MKAEALLRERHVVNANAFVDLRIWRVPRPVKGAKHLYKYALAYVVAGECVLRYDNEAGKGDHRHDRRTESAHAFTTPEALLRDFWADVDQWRSK
ncbi:MAG: hypothetical protein IT562_19850 [Alphaproteobacteria bacterium]|nr:hypothetical protein [Alphaproteobacteria bacterium]